MKKLVVMFVSIALFADEKVAPSQAAKIIACGQGTEKRTMLWLLNQEATYDWYLFDDNVLLLAGQKWFEEEKVIVESTKKDNQIVITKITNKEDPKVIRDFKTGKIMQAENEIGEISQNFSCFDLKDFFEAHRKSQKEQISRIDILKKNLEKQQKETDRSERALFVLENKNSK